MVDCWDFESWTQPVGLLIVYRGGTQGKMKMPEYLSILCKYSVEESPGKIESCFIYR